jgi:4-hydroxybenzoate polyprenyltransferase
MPAAMPASTCLPDATKAMLCHHDKSPAARTLTQRTKAAASGPIAASSASILSPPRRAASESKSWLYHLHTIWLFTFSDLKTIIIPKITFGTLSALSHQTFRLPPPHPSTSSILARIPLVCLWTWINLLPFAIDNQRQPKAILEDSLNKPWRPMPSKRLSPRAAKRLMLVLYPCAILTSFVVGGHRQCLALVALGFWYNDLAGADTSCIVRNFINAAGFVAYMSGAMEVALNLPSPTLAPLVFPEKLLQWFAILAGVVFTTVQTQDMYDQAGDSLRNRRTVPLVVGDGCARWTIAIPMCVWSGVVLWFWGAQWQAWVVLGTWGLAIAWRSLTLRAVQDDKMTFKLWNLWLMALYTLPLVKGFL